MSTKELQGQNVVANPTIQAVSQAVASAGGVPQTNKPLTQKQIEKQKKAREAEMRSMITKGEVYDLIRMVRTSLDKFMREERDGVAILYAQVQAIARVLIAAGIVTEEQLDAEYKKVVDEANSPEEPITTDKKEKEEATEQATPTE